MIAPNGGDQGKLHEGSTIQAKDDTAQKKWRGQNAVKQSELGHLCREVQCCVLAGACEPLAIYMYDVCVRASDATRWVCGESQPSRSQLEFCGGHAQEKGMP